MILDDIVAARRRRLAELMERVPPGRMAERAERESEKRRLAARERHVFGEAAGGSFRERLQAVAAAGRVPVIAEVKRASPSAGAIARPGHSPAGLAAAYRAGGAAAVSVLTEPDFFGAMPGDLEAAAAASGLPVLRKDFTVDPYQVDEAMAMGAHAVLLIAAVLSGGDLRRCLARADELGLDALVEVHDERELDRALGAGARLLGVNNRDLRTFEVDLATTERIAAELARIGAGRSADGAAGEPSGIPLVSESGIRGPEDVRRALAAGADAVLVGEALVRAPDPAALLESLACATVPREDPVL